MLSFADPHISSHFPPEYLQRVKQVHSTGGYGSQGHGYDWKAEEAERNLLRTRITAVSARMLYLLAREVSTRR
jgi:phenylalanyl-tRNA synthetase alpha chain